MNNFIHAIDGFYANDTDFDSLCIENKHWDKLNEKGLVGKIYYKEKTFTNPEVSSMVSF